MDSIAGVINTMLHWNMYQGSLLSICVGEMSPKKSVCMTCLWVGLHLIWMAGVVDWQ